MLNVKSSKEAGCEYQILKSFTRNWSK